jgi:WD40 repeat protein
MNVLVEKFYRRSFVLQVRTLVGHDDEVTSTSFSLDGKRVVSGSLDKCVKIWDVETGALVRNLPGTSF